MIKPISSSELGFVVVNKKHLRLAESRLLKGRGVGVCLTGVAGKCFAWEVGHYLEVVGTVLVAEHIIVEVFEGLVSEEPTLNTAP